MPEITIETQESSSNDATMTENSETISDIVETVTEAVKPETTENDVAIVAIEADKEIQIAEINAEARKVEAKEYQAWNEENLRSMIREEVNLAITPLMQPSLAQPEIVEITEEAAETIADNLSEIVTENSGTPNDTALVEPETPMELGGESVAEKLGVEAPPVLELGRKPIIKLV